MGRTALSGATGVFAAMALGGGAQAGPTGASTPAAVAAAPNVATSGSTTDVTLNQSRTIIDWKTLDVGKDETLNFRFQDKSWIVLNRTPGTARIDGALNGCVVTCGTVGGNVWIFGAGGVLFGPNARVNVGSLLATTTPISSEMDFLSGRSTNFTFQGGASLASVQVQAGAQIAAHGGALALVAPQVETDAGSSLSATGAVLVGAAQSYRIRFDASAGGGLDLLDFEVPASAMEDGTVSATPIAVNGAVAGSRVVLAAVSRPTVMNALISLGGAVTATGAAAGEGGSIVLTGSGSAGSTVDVSGALVAHGGRIDVTAPAVTVEGRIDVSAPSGGGAVRIGGGAAGQDATIANADTVTLGAGSVVDASATAAGDGGAVTVWSNRATDFRGTILARGGPSGGNGGSAEVSGGWLNYAGTANLLAPRGLTGNLLLDPDDITITHGAAVDPAAFPAATGTPPSTVNNGGVSPITDGTINQSLAGANVTVQTTSGGAITFGSAAGTTYGFTGTGKLTLNAQGAVGFANPVGSVVQVDNAGGLEIDAGAAFSLAGASIKSSAKPLILSAPGITIDGVIDLSSSPTVAGDLTLTSTGAGAISETAAGAVTATTLSGSSGGSTTLTQAANAIKNLGTFASTAGDFSLTTGTGLDVTGGLNAAGRTVQIITTGALTESSGTIAAASLGFYAQAGVANLSGANVVTTLTEAQADGGAFFNNAQALTYTALDATLTPRGTDLNLRTASGDLTYQNPVNSSASVILNAAGALTLNGLIAPHVTGALYSVTASTFTAASALPLPGTADPLTPILGATTGFSVGFTGGAFDLNTIGTKTIGGAFTVTASGAITDGGTTGLNGASIALTAPSVAPGKLQSNGGAITATATGGGTVNFTQAVDAGAGALTVTAGSVTQASAGGITAGALAGTVSGVTDLTTSAANAIASVGAYSNTGGAFSLKDTVNLDVAGVLDATGQTVSLTLPSLGETAAGAVKATTLQGAVTGSTDLTASTSNAVVNLGAFSNTGANFAISDSVALNIAGALNVAGHQATLNATGLTQSAAGSVTAATLAGAVTGVTDLTTSTANAVTNLGAFSNTGGSFSLKDSVGLTITGVLDATGRTVALTLPSLGEASTGAVKATTLQGTVSGVTDLTGSTANAVTNLGAFSNTGGDFALTDSTALNVSGAVNAGAHTVTLNAASFTEGGAGAITAATLTGSSSGATALTNASNAITNLGAFTNTGGDFALTNGGSLNVSGAVNATGHTVTLSAASFTEGGGGAITATTLTGSSSGATAFTSGSNAVANLGGFTNTGGDFALTNGGALNVSGAVDATGHTVTLNATALTEDAAASITAATLSATGTNGVSLTNGTNAFATLSVLSASGAGASVAVKDGQTLTVSSDVNVGGSVSLTTTSGGLSTAAVTAGSDLTLRAAGTLNAGALDGAGNVVLVAGGGAGAGAALATGTVRVGKAYTIDGASFNAAAQSPTFTGAQPTANDFNLTQRTGSVATGAIAVATIGGDFTITATNGSVTGNGALSGHAVTIAGQAVQVGNLTATGGDIALTSSAGPVELTAVVNAGTAAGGQTVKLSATGGAVTQDAGATITAGKLDAAGSGGVALGLANSVGELVRLVDTSPGPAGAGALFNGVAANPGGLTVDRASSANGSVSITNTGDVRLNGDVSATGAIGASGHTATITSTGGAVTQAAAGYVTAATLVASGATGVVLDAASNREVTSVSLSGGSGGARFLDTATGVLSVTQALAQGDVALTNGAGLSLTGPVRATDPAARVTLSALSGQIVESGTDGVDGIQADVLSAEARDGVLLDTLTNDVAQIVRLANTGAGGARFEGGARDLTIGGAGASDPVVNGGTGNVSITDGGAISLQGKVTAPTTGAARSVSLAAGGALTQTSAGLITAGALTATGAGAGPGLAVGLDQAANVVGEVTNLAATGAGGAALTLGTAGTLIDAASGGAGALSIGNTGALTLGGVVAAGAGAVLTLNAGDQINQTGGRLDGGSLVAVGGSGVHLTSTTNSIVTVTRLSDTGTVASAGTTLGAEYTGAGAVTVARADTAAGASVLPATGNLTLRANGGALTLAGPVGVGATHTVSLTATGAVSQSGGAVVAGIVTGSGAGFALTSPTNVIGRLQAVDATTGDLTLVDATDPGAPVTNLALGGALSGHAVSFTTSGTLVQDGASVITAQTLTGAATGGLSLGGVNAVDQVTSLVNAGTGDVAFTNGTGALTVQTLSAAMGNLTLATGGALSLTGALTAATTGPSQTATITAGGAVSQAAGASVTAGVLTGGTSGGSFVLDAAGNAFGELAALTAPTAITLKDSAGLEVTGAVLAGGALTITAPQLTLDAGASLGGANAALTATGAGGISLAGLISTATGQTTLTASTGPITQSTPGAIVASAVQATAMGGITLVSVAAQSPTILNVVSLNNSGSGNIDVTLGGPATFGTVANTAGVSPATGGAISIVDLGGGLTFNGAVSARDTLVLNASGALVGTGASSSASTVTLTGAGVAFSGAVAGSGAVLVNAGSGAASFGSLGSTTSDVTVTAGGAIGVSGALNVGRDLALTGASLTGNALAPTFAAGTGRDFHLTDTAGGLTYTTLRAPRDLIVVATDPAAGDSAPISGGTLISTAGAIQVTGTSLNLTGGVSAPTAGVTLTATRGAIGLGGAVNAGTQAATLSAGTTVTETGAGGAITAGSLVVGSNGAIDLRGDNAVPLVTALTNAGGGGVRFNDIASTVQVASVTTAGGDIALTAPSGTLTLASTVTSPGALTLSSGGLLTAGVLTANGGALSATGAGVTLTGDATASTDLAVAAGAGDAQLQNVTATGGALSVTGRALTLGAAVSGTTLTLAGTGAVNTGAIHAGTALNASGASLTLGATTAGGTATLASPGAVTLTTLTGATGVSIDSGALQASTIAATAGALQLRASTANLGAATSGGAVDVATTGAFTADTVSSGPGAALGLSAGGLATVRMLSAGGALTLSGGSISLTTGAAGASATVTSGGAVGIGGLTAATDLSLNTGALQATTLAATTGGLTVRATTANLGTATAGGSLDAAASAGDLAADTLGSGGAMTVASTGATTVRLLTAGGALALSGGSIGLTTGTAGASATVTSAGPVSIGALTAATDLSLDTGTLQATTLAATAGELRLRASTANLGSATAGGVLDAATTGDLTADTLGSGGAFTLAATGPATVRLLTAGGPLTLSGGSIALTTGTSGAAATVTSAGPVAIGSLTAVTDLSLDTGALQATTLAATGGNLALSATTANLGTATAGGAIDASTTGDATADTLTSGGALTLAAGGAATVRQLTAGGALTLSGGSVDLTSGASAAAATVTSAGPVTIGSLTAATDLSLQAAALNATTLAATGGDLTVRAGAATLGSATAGGGLDVQTTGDLAADALTAGGAARVASAADATVTTLTAGGPLTASASGLLKVATLTGGADVALQAGTLSLGDGSSAGAFAAASDGDATVGTATAGGDLAFTVGGALTATSLKAGDGHAPGTTGSATLRAGSLDVGTLTAALDGSATTTGGPATLGAAVAGRDLLLSLAGSLDAAALQVGRNLTATSPGAISVGGITAGAAGAVSVSGQDVRLGAAAGATPVAGQALVAGPGVSVRIAASRDLALNLYGPAAFTMLQAARDLDFATTGGDAVAGSLSAGGALMVAAHGGSASIGTLALTGGGPAAITAEQDVVLGRDFAGSTLSIPGGRLTLDAGRDAVVAYPGAVSLASVRAGRNATITSGDAVTLPALTAGGDASVAGASLLLTSLNAGGSFDGRASAGDATLDAAVVGGDLSLASATGAAALRDVRMTGAQAGARTLTVTAAGQASIGRATDAGALGSLALDDASRTHVVVRSTGSSGAAARIDVNGAATLAEATSASGDVIVKATGAVTGAPTGPALFAANRALNVVSGGDIVMGGLSTAGGAALVDAQGTLTLASLTANTATLRATDLTLTGALTGTSACSPACPAPTVVIESRKGALIVGDAPADTSAFPSGGMTVDNAELGRVKGDSVALYAGDTTDAAARGDIGVGNVDLDGAAIRKLSLLAGPAATVTVAGVVAPRTADVGDLVIGGAKSADGWTPKSVRVTGALGKPGTGVTAAGGAALHSVELNGIRDVLIGGRTFVAAITGAETADGANAITAINITRGLPIGVQPAIADLNRNIVTAGTLTLRSDGYVVQQNTGASGQQGGVLLTNPDKVPFVLTLGRVGGPSASGSLIPALIDLSIGFVNSSGTLLNRQVAATSPAVDTSGLSRSDAYRINGCTIGTAGTCTPLPNTIVDIRINKLVEGVQIASEDPPAIDDPTITGAGNEEIWRSPASSCVPGKGRECK